ncbi:hypothetical protein [Hymenobacter sp. YC55]|uniref:hypothetical protein n=1 Tax=Hymenobacter sp. YC55 TaxID=3034019 RepID=UPI0023F8AC38|nr:hypothetical protein [Hymenobacter sp. YC55]MDF7810751.1 hypothetical protein [Hymenobacter sp. YC55]
MLLYYLNQVPCVFAFRLADTKENRARGRVGQLSGFRTGVRNPNFIPSTQRAKSKSAGKTRYYDQGRQSWRSWRPGLLVSVTAFWSEELQAFVDTPQEAGILAGKEFEAKPAKEPKQDAKRAERAAKREAAKREREKIRKRLKKK